MAEEADTLNHTSHTWAFRARFRRNCFGWKSQPAIVRVKEAVAEIRKVAKRDLGLAADGAVLFLEKVSPALEQVDSSSGSIGTAVNNAIAALVPRPLGRSLCVSRCRQRMGRPTDRHHTPCTQPGSTTRHLLQGHDSLPERA